MQSRLAIVVLLAAAPVACAPAVAPPASSPVAPAPTVAAASTVAAAPSVVATVAPAEAASAPPAGVAPADAGPAPPPIPKGTAVLHVGDSFALAGFAQALRPHMKALGVRYEVRSEQSSFTTTWSAKMDRLVADTQPDLVIITLGANEVQNVDPAAHAPAVRRIVASIGDRPCVWISAPSWRKDTGINDVIRENSAPCRFFDSDKLVTQPIERQADHIHPNEQGGAVWAEAFWAWLGSQRVPAPDGDKGKPRPWRLRPAGPDEHARKP
jgi:lysophospholipase L1-like esterase